MAFSKEIPWTNWSSASNPRAHKTKGSDYLLYRKRTHLILTLFLLKIFPQKAKFVTCGGRMHHALLCPPTCRHVIKSSPWVPCHKYNFIALTKLVKVPMLMLTHDWKIGNFLGFLYFLWALLRFILFYFLFICKVYLFLL